MERVEGWILDLHPGHVGEMTAWVKTRKGPCLQVIDQWYPALCVAGIKDDLNRLTRRLEAEGSVLGWRFTERYARLQDPEPSEVLEVTVADASRLRTLAQELSKLGGYQRLRPYNVDIPPEQMYLYEKNLSPLACSVNLSGLRPFRYTLPPSKPRGCSPTSPEELTELPHAPHPPSSH